MHADPGLAPVEIRESPRRRLLGAGIVFTVVAGTLALWFAARDREEAAARREAHVEVDSAIARLGNGFQNTSGILASAAALLEPSGQIDRERLETYANLLIVSGPVNAVTFSPVVAHADRAAFEQRTGHEIRDRGPDGVLVRAPDRESYMPVAEVISPTPLPIDVVGFDFARDQQRASTVAAALQSNSAMVTPVVQLAGTGRPGFIIVQVLARPGGRAPAGLLTVGYDARRVGEGIAEGLPAGTTFRISDDGKELFSSAGDRSPSFTYDLPIGGRVWRFDYATPLNISRTMSVTVLMTGLGIAGLVALAAAFAFRHERRLLLWRLQTALERDLAAELARSAGLAEVAATAAETIRVVAAAKSVSLGLIEGDRLHLQHSTTVPDHVVERWTDLPLDDTLPIGEAARTGRVIALRDLDEIRAAYPSMDIDPADGARAAACVPLRVGDEPIGALAFTYAAPQAFDQVQLRWLRQIADMVSGALERARLYDHQQRVVLALQRDLLPEDLPTHDGFALSALYRPGDSSQLGGDWYDAFELGDGRLAIAIGDVAGRGVRAAASMGKLRHLIRACAGAYREPALVLAHANELICQGSRQVFATVLYATIDADGTCTLASAGHLPPLVVSSSGASLSQIKPGPPLGVTRAGTYTDTSLALSPGDALVLYTDGLVERRNEPLDVSLELFAAVASAMPGDCDAESLVASVGSDDRDDVAVLLVRLAREARRATLADAELDPAAGGT